MEAGIVGLPNVGKSSLYNALTAGGAEASNYPFCTIEPNSGVVPVPDKRLDLIAAHISTERIIPAMLKVVDIAGIVRGASKGEGLGNKFLSHIREVDAVLHVVRCFDDDKVTHVDGGMDPIRDIETIETELMMADLDVIENALPKLMRLVRGKDAAAIVRHGVFERSLEALKRGTPVRALDWSAEALREIRGCGLLTGKPVLYVANVAEDQLLGDNAHVKTVSDYAEKNGGEMVKVCAKIEAELIELEPEDRAELLGSLGLAEPALNAVISSAYHLLGLQSYFTAGPKEVRAWTVPVGCRGPQAAGVIHTDFERGFIRAECYSVDDLVKYKTEAGIKAAGKLRVEGKDYVMQDSDVVHFLFNV
ncbi:MAG: redox-regulated ATPase YchF [Verrucomicrobia bacterium]|nr:redox-regulated ATPase YchF [Verrucomicrobiota bacterium]